MQALFQYGDQKKNVLGNPNDLDLTYNPKNSFTRGEFQTVFLQFVVRILGLKGVSHISFGPCDLFLFSFFLVQTKVQKLKPEFLP